MFVARIRVVRVVGGGEIFHSTAGAGCATGFDAKGDRRRDFVPVGFSGDLPHELRSLSVYPFRYQLRRTSELVWGRKWGKRLKGREINISQFW